MNITQIQEHVFDLFRKLTVMDPEGQVERLKAEGAPEGLAKAMANYTRRKQADEDTIPAIKWVIDELEKSGWAFMVKQ